MELLRLDNGMRLFNNRYLDRAITTEAELIEVLQILDKRNPMPTEDIKRALRFIQQDKGSCFYDVFDIHSEIFQFYNGKRRRLETRHISRYRGR